MRHAGFYSAKNEAAAKALGVKRVCIPNRATKNLALKREQKKRWFRNGQKWRTGCEGRRPPVAHAVVEDRPIYGPAYRTGACPFDMKLTPGARRRMRTVGWLANAIVASLYLDEKKRKQARESRAATGLITRSLTHGDARRIAGDGTGASTSRRIGCVLARIAFSEVRHRGEKAFS